MSNATTWTLQEALAEHAPLRIIIRRSEGTFLGLVEHSFSMGLDPERALLFWSGKAVSNLGTEHTLDAARWAKGNTKEGDLVLDPLSPDCPVRVDLEAWHAAKRKFEQRNPPFTIINAEALQALWEAQQRELTARKERAERRAVEDQIRRLDNRIVRLRKAEATVADQLRRAQEERQAVIERLANTPCSSDACA
jgi:hypothetical protein